MVRWAAVEAISKNHGDDPIKAITGGFLNDEAATKGGWLRPKLLTLVYYGLRVGEIRSLVPPEAT